MHRRMIAAGIALFLAWPALGRTTEGVPDVHYVPTPQYVVSEMLELAGTTKDDVIYDLGCGDGRFVITAAKRYGARGVGVDLDGELLRISRENARKAGVERLVDFLKQDLFETDIKKATIVALYLLPELNLSLRPRLLKELRPGTRVLSHDFNMGEWKPDAVGEIGASTYYLWIIPADVRGLWHVSVPALGRVGLFRMAVTQEFQEIKAEIPRPAPEGAFLSQAKLRGERISFFLNRGTGRTRTGMYFKGKVAGNTMTGTVEIDADPFLSHLLEPHERPLTGTFPWTAVRAAP